MIWTFQATIYHFVKLDNYFDCNIYTPFDINGALYVVCIINFWGHCMPLCFIRIPWAKTVITDQATIFFFFFIVYAWILWGLRLRPKIGPDSACRLQLGVVWKVCTLAHIVVLDWRLPSKPDFVSQLRRIHVYISQWKVASTYYIIVRKYKWCH